MQLKPESLLGDRHAAYAQRYEEHEKLAALEIFREHGAVRASVETGISASTIGAWASRYGIESLAPASQTERVQKLRLHWAERRAILAERVGDLAEIALERTYECVEAGLMRDARDGASVMATAIDKAQLLTGGVTERVGVSDAFVEREAEIEQARSRAREITSQTAHEVPTAFAPPDPVPDPVSSEPEASEPFKAAAVEELAPAPSIIIQQPATLEPPNLTHVGTIPVPGDG